MLITRVILMTIDVVMHGSHDEHEIFTYKVLLSVILYLNALGLRSPKALWRKHSKYLQTHTSRIGRGQSTLKDVIEQ